MRKLIFTALLAAITLPVIPANAQQNGNRHQQQERAAERRDDRQEARRDDRREAQRDNRRYRQNRQQARAAWQDYNRYDYNRFDPRYGSYQAERYYRDGRYYQQRRLTNNDRIYRGSNGRYYCRRNDGTTGLIIGALGGGILGNAIAPRGSKTLGAILGGSAGALIGRSIGRDGVHCD
jgi:hypothetical protein